MKTYIFKLLVEKGVIEVRIAASGYFAAESAVLAMYPDSSVLSWDTD
ncbi:MAG TPA: hypothetical protein PK402_02475 [Tepidisphaeraceae bacterium]|nr:hypothetical protein [Tepidisphaeraceae bacterium]